MGMYDSFHFIGDLELVPRCAAGHALVDDLQTKDLRRVLANYYVYHDRVGFPAAIARESKNALVFGGDGNAFMMEENVDRFETKWTIGMGEPLEDQSEAVAGTLRYPTLVRTTRERMVFRRDIDGPVSIHGSCDRCAPVVSRQLVGLGLSESEPWCEWSLVFDHGVLRRIDPVRLETRDQLREDMIRRGHLVLADDDPEARALIDAHDRTLGEP